MTPVENTIIVVDEEPYCIWEVDIHERNMEFLNGIDTEYFNYLLDVHLSAADEKRAAIAIRTTFHHALETLFLLLGSYVQAPDCAYAWIAKCSNRHLRSILGKINFSSQDHFTRLKVERVSWDSIADQVFHYMPNTEKSDITKKLFAQFWRQLAHDYLERNHIDEYNSIKHGFRVRSGGFALRVGAEHEPGIPPPNDEMHLTGSSEHGTSFFRLEPIGDANGNRSLRSRRVSLNWKIERIILQLQLVSMSIKNVTSALKIVNGANPGECKFVRPSEDNDFAKPWCFTPGVTSCNMDYVIDDSQAVQTTKKELLERLSELSGS